MTAALELSRVRPDGPHALQVANVLLEAKHLGQLPGAWITRVATDLPDQYVAWLLKHFDELEDEDDKAFYAKLAGLSAPVQATGREAARLRPCGPRG